MSRQVNKAFRKLRRLPVAKRRAFLLSLPDDVRHAVAVKAAGG